ncbi:unnamed protein product, partial [Symbiodinium sp. CCMP2456]
IYDTCFPRKSKIGGEGLAQLLPEQQEFLLHRVREEDLRKGGTLKCHQIARAVVAFPTMSQVLDVGAGTAPCKPVMEDAGFKYTAQLCGCAAHGDPPLYSAMAARPENVEEWCYLVPHLFSPAGWNSIAEAKSVSLSYCSCPWGGSLVKLTVLDVQVADAPDDPSQIFVRPESRAWWAKNFAESSPEHFTVKEQLAPGDAIICRWASWKVLRVFAVLFGEIGTELLQTQFYDPAEAVELHMRTQRNHPEAGDCSQTIMSPSQPFEAINFCRSAGEKGVYNVYHIFRVPSGINLSNWAAAQLNEAMESGRRVAEYYLNRPGISRLRALDQQFYVVLTIQTFKRGFPLMPVRSGEEHEDVTRIDAGNHLGLATWVRYDPAKYGIDGFYLSGYMQALAECLGESLQFYQFLDGKELLYFQCAVAREEWSRVQDRLKDAYLLQKTAYRRANGGAQAPGLNEASTPRFCTRVRLTSLEERIQAEAAARGQQKVQVRKTFIEREESEAEELFDAMHYNGTEGIAGSVFLQGYGQIDVVSDIGSIPLPDESFDLVICTDVLEHVLNPKRAMHEMGRLLKPGGIVLLQVPFGGALHNLPHHYFAGFTHKWFEKVASAASLEVAWGYHFETLARRLQRSLQSEECLSGIFGGKQAAAWRTHVTDELPHVLEHLRVCQSNPEGRAD